MEEKIKKLSKLLSFEAASKGLSVSAAGWVPIYQVLEYMDIRVNELRKLISQDVRCRLEIRNSMIRCAHGHSEAMPVNAGSLEASWTRFLGRENLWCGTSLDHLPIIAELGIKPIKKTHIQLSKEREHFLWKRKKVAVILEISTKGLKALPLGLFEASNGVVLARFVPETSVVRAHLKEKEKLSPTVLQFIPPKWR